MFVFGHQTFCWLFCPAGKYMVFCFVMLSVVTESEKFLLSLKFSLLILLGYACGIAHKVLENMDWVFWLYLLNTAFLLIDIFLYLKYKDNKAPADCTTDEDEN